MGGPVICSSDGHQVDASKQLGHSVLDYFLDHVLLRKAVAPRSAASRLFRIGKGVGVFGRVFVVAYVVFATVLYLVDARSLLFTFLGSYFLFAIILATEFLSGFLMGVASDSGSARRGRADLSI